MIQPGSTLAHYEITSALGKGGMGEVWRARDTKLGREVAIKTLPDAFSKDVDRLARFEREAKMLAALNHPHIAAIYGLEEHDGTRFLVLELVEGETLAERLHRGPLSIEESLKLGLQIAQALEAAHDKGVIHRDLKPANIKVTPHGGIKVLDFGLAKALADNTDAPNPANSPTLSMQATAQGMILGTAAYMAPEQAKAHPVDKRADVWAFGCVLYEMLTGRQVFAGPDVSTILARVLDRDPDLGVLPSNLDPRISDLIARALEKDPATRWHDIADVRVTLQKVLADPDRGRVVPAASSAEVSPQSKQVWIAAVVVAAVAASLGTWLLTPGPAPQPVVRSVISVRENPPATQQFRTIAITPDGTGVVYGTPGPEGASLYLRRLDELEGGWIRGSLNAVDPVFSPDGSSIAFASGASGAFERVSILGGPTTTLYTLNANPFGATWGPDDTIISGVQASPGLSRMPAVGGEREFLTDTSRDGPHYWPEYLPGGKSVLFTIVRGTGSENHQVAVLDLESNEQTILVPGASHARYAESGHLVYAIDDTLWAVGFDPDRLEVLTDPVPVVEGVATGRANGVSQFDIASNGSLAYITQIGPVDTTTGGAAPMRLTIFDTGGTTRMLDAPPRAYRNPRISPNGDQVAVEIIDGDQNSIWIYNLSGGSAIRRLTQVSEGNNTRPLWTPDGERITFASDRDGTQSIYSQPADGSGPAEQLTVAEEGTFHYPDTWSPNGELSFGLTRGTPGPANWEVWVRDADGESAVFYDLPGLNQFGSAFSPDGNWLAYTSGESNTNSAEFRVFVAAYPSGTRYEVAGDGSSWPVWASDGSALFYRLSIGGGRVPTLNSVAIQTEPVFSYTAEENVFVQGFSVFQNYRDYDPLPDGSGFIMLTPADQPTPDATTETDPLPDPEVILVQNFFEELKRLVPVP